MEPATESKTRHTLLWVWAISATVVGLVATGLLLFLHLSPQRSHAGWTRWKVSEGGNGHWYKAVAMHHDVTWSGAEQLARLEGGYLATITSAAENNFVFGLINTPEFFTDDYGNGPALGGYQQDGSPEPDGGWCWVTGEPWNYSKWFRNEPSNGRAPSGTEDRLHYYSSKGRTPAPMWNDAHRTDKNKILSYVVERDK